MTPDTTRRKRLAIACLLADEGPLKVTRIEIALSRRGEPAYPEVLPGLLADCDWFRPATPGNKQTRWDLTAKGRRTVRTRAAKGTP